MTESSDPKPSSYMVEYEDGVKESSPSDVAQAPILVTAQQQARIRRKVSMA